MNVAFDPWIPVVSSSGRRELASLCSVLAEGEKYADLAVRPHERVALMRLFLCVAHAALDGPKNYDEWCEVPKRLPEAARTYLTEWKDSFELFHPTKPWLQVANLKPAKENDEKSFTPLAKLDFSLASGSNSTLFDHEGANNSDRLFDLTQLVLGLISIQNFSTCGLLSRPLWNGVATPDSAKDAPCITSSMYHVFLVGKDVAETVCINLCDFEELSFFMSGSPGENWLGRPVWEQMPMNVTDAKSGETFLGRLTPLSRAIRFLEGGTKMLYGEALRYATYPDFPQEFNTSVAIRKMKNKQERFLVGARLNIRPWRQLDAILQYNLSGGTISHALNLNHLEGEAIDIWVGALVRNPGKQDILDSVESRFHISRQFRTETGCATYASEVQTAQSVANLLDTAVYLYRLELDPSDGKGLGSTATSHYWTTVESNLQLLMNHIEAIGSNDAIPTKQMWRSKLYAAAREAYRIACGQETPRQMKAFAKGWQKLTSAKDEPESESNDNETREENP
ncbi:CRISPR system Cascade subunit CasA [Geobacter argillaceus]|uniref:CRISPR system Cascade subunit CasA n=1 Tax=Geobacter argillaceus TaxID=345631 RepID=A0A562VKQ4_9BACT|nr:type I-E CRISPR-associated protein Cse1/CasA [Geobacter argillaceus]TWJ18392.1 CRISPR system Cascade subunit CasA [Geobacter argillaceus]